MAPAVAGIPPPPPPLSILMNRLSAIVILSDVGVSKASFSVYVYANALHVWITPTDYQSAKRRCSAPVSVACFGSVSAFPSSVTAGRQ